ncbi:DUF2225 domain-containing protein [Bacillus sp. FJAT-42376]|uniref:DUF2225 domain-containing protein n=1 Tax=Bacillus sp. FJAT-42376 TaxID=2014076 RepID=UPI000F4D6653|nr:DUF2225 domain-containing protein [Bacillus sp. FJAT-42376]AZB44276.1 DUF2225 domain-containing protein [Bacillus sp. FJAT-42376]
METPYLYDKNTTCTLCSFQIRTKKLRSSFIRIDYSESDFYSKYKGDHCNPLLYYVTVCPNCGYSFSDEFTPRLSAPARNQLIKYIWEKWSKKDYCQERTPEMAISAYKLAIYCAGLKSEKHSVKAGLHHRLAWMYRDAENKEEELRFLKLALEEYLQSYMKEDYLGSKLTEMKVLYLIGELSRRTGKENQAVRYFSRMIENQSVTKEKGIIEMAKDRWQEMREERAKQKLLM